MNELRVHIGKHRNLLQLLVWCNDTLHQHTNWNICELHNSEVELNGGRFRFYREGVGQHTITFHIERREAINPAMLDWIGETIESPWSMTFTPADPVPVGVGYGMTCVETDLHLHFDDADEAMLCLLKFR